MCQIHIVARPSGVKYLGLLPPSSRSFPAELSDMSSSRNIEDTYEAQNDQRLDELHSKLRTLRGVRAEAFHQSRVLTLE